jgi:peptidoglycan/xylan/chitin deacetylase (PgdA/CDA1 family)
LKKALRNSIGYILAIVLIILGYVRRAKIKALQTNAILAIGFHHPDAKLFKNVITWLGKNGFVFISSSHLIDILDKKEPCPPGAVWVSLDDGWRGNINNVIPVVIKYNIPITIFICTGAMEDGTYWWRKVQLSRKNTVR